MTYKVIVSEKMLCTDVGKGRFIKRYFLFCRKVQKNVYNYRIWQLQRGIFTVKKID